MSTRNKKRPSAAPKSAKAPQREEDAHIGLRLRHARMTRRMTLRELAERAGCSESLLSKVENERAMPSLSTLHRLCRCLDLTVMELFARPNAPPGIVSRAGERPVLKIHPLRPNSNVTVEQLIPFKATNLLEGSIHLIPSGTGGRDLISHQGEEVMYVLEGTLEVTVGSEKYILHEGDSVHIRSELPHGYHNPGPTPARALVVNTPPTF